MYSSGHTATGRISLKWKRHIGDSPGCYLGLEFALWGETGWAGTFSLERKRLRGDFIERCKIMSGLDRVNTQSFSQGRGFKI